MNAQQYDLVGNIMAYESGELDDDASVDLFQHLINTGMAWQLQGSYGRTATALLSAGIVKPSEGHRYEGAGSVKP